MDVSSAVTSGLGLVIVERVWVWVVNVENEAPVDAALDDSSPDLSPRLIPMQLCMCQVHEYEYEL